MTVREIKPPFIKSANNYHKGDNSDLDTIEDFGPSLTVQSQKEDADINVIAARYGLNPPISDKIRQNIGDYSETTFDFHQAMNQVRAAQETFNQIPAKIRARFENDAGQFLDFVHDPDNLDEMRRLGLAKPKAPETPPVAPAGATPTPQPPGEPQGGGTGSGQSPTQTPPK